MSRLFKFLLIAVFIVLAGFTEPWAFKMDFKNGVNSQRVSDVDGVSFETAGG